MSGALQKAFGDADRSFFAAKASVATASTGDIMASGSSGLPTSRPDLMNAAEQLRHFRGWVYSSIRPIAQRIAGQPIRVGRVRAGGLTTKAADVTPLNDHPILKLLADPNDLMVAWSLLYITISSLELTGRSLWWLPKQQQILPIPTSWIRNIEGTASITGFKVQPPNKGEHYTIPADQCVYFNYPHPGDPHGALSPLQAVAGAVDADEAMTTSQVTMFRRGIHPSHIITVGKNPHPDVPGGIRPRLSAPQQRQIIHAIKQRYAGVHAHGEPVILDGLIEDVKRLSNTPSEMDWLNSGKITKSRIVQGFGTNPIIMGEIEGANRASATMADEIFCSGTINPKIELLSQTLTAWLRPMFGDDLVIWIEPAIANDVEMRLKWADTLARYGQITGDELRELSPFELKQGQFPDPVAASSSKRDPQLDEAIAALSAEPVKVLQELIDKASLVDPDTLRLKEWSTP